MNVDFSVNKNTCFYYWLQELSDWNPYLSGININVSQLNNTEKLSAQQTQSLEKIKNILRRAKEPIGILAELYSDNITSKEASEIVRLSAEFVEQFGDIWADNFGYLNKWRDALKLIDFSTFNDSLKKIANFFESDTDISDLYNVRLVQSNSKNIAKGHFISGTKFILIRPPLLQSDIELKSVVYALVHEYIHTIEFKSKISRDLFKKSYEKYIKINNLQPPTGYKWKQMYTEAIAYCFASNIIGGYLQPEISHESKPTLEDLTSKFHKILSKEKYNTIDVINWAALNVIADVEQAIENNQKIDQNIADKISKVFLEFYLTNNQ